MEIFLFFYGSLCAVRSSCLIWKFYSSYPSWSIIKTHHFFCVQLSAFLSEHFAQYPVWWGPTFGCTLLALMLFFKGSMYILTNRLYVWKIRKLLIFVCPNILLWMDNQWFQVGNGPWAPTLIAEYWYQTKSNIGHLRKGPVNEKMPNFASLLRLMYLWLTIYSDTD